MKLLLANNQSSQFRQFYADLQAQSAEPFDYASYNALLFMFNFKPGQPVAVLNLEHNRDLTDYDGVYINGYLKTYELAAATAIACQALHIGFANQELREPPSLSKLSMYAKLAAGGISVPPTLAGTKQALLRAQDHLTKLTFPAVLKRADADRGVDNYKVADMDEIVEILGDHDERSLWLLQAYIPNDGFYLLSFYGPELAFCIFRSLEARPDGQANKAHMYKPKGGSNASLVDLPTVPEPLVKTCRQAMQLMNRQIGSVDCLYDSATQTVHVLEVNYNPQLVTISTFKDVRIQAFLDYLPELGRAIAKN